MSDTTDAVVAKLREELGEILRQTLHLLATVRVRAAIGGHGQIERVYDPSPDQGEIAKKNEGRFALWTTAVASMLARRSVAGAAGFRNAAEEFGARVGLTARGTAYCLESQWRRESLAFVSAHCDTLTAALDSIVHGPVTGRGTADTVDVLVVPEGPAHWRIRTECAGSSVEEVVPAPCAPDAIEAFVEQHCGPRRQIAGNVQPLAELGRKLFDAIFSGQAAPLYRKSHHCAVRLQIRAQRDLETIPWELLHDGDHFIALTERIHVVRLLEPRPASGSEPVMQQPVRILVTCSTPRSLRWLDVDRERTQIADALAPLVHFGGVQVDYAGDGTLNTVRRLLRAAREAGRPYHVWHFSGHGAFHPPAGASAVTMTTAAGEPHDAGAIDLSTLFVDEPALRLVVFNSCEGGATAALAAALGVAPTVVAMQFTISDEAAIAFAAELYGALAEGSSVDAAVASARRAIFCTPNYTEWATPVLFSRARPGL